MSLVKSMRKNKSKLMVFLLIFIMVTFVIGASLQPIINQINAWFSSGKNVAVYGKNVDVTEADLQQARTELQILQEMMAPDYLNRSDQQRNRNTKDVFLSLLLFPDSRMVTSEYFRLKYEMAMQQNALQASQEQIDAFFNQIEGRNDVYWMLLKTEARNAGIAVSDDLAKAYLSQMIPAFTGNNMTAAALVSNVSQRYQKRPEDVIRTFSELLGVSAYAASVLSNEDITVAQVKSLLGLSSEKINAEMVQFRVSPYEPNLPKPTEDQIEAQFDKYKDSFSGVYTEDNPSGFGYKQPATVTLEYMIVKLDDIKKTIAPPTFQEMQDYYQNNIQEFTDQVPTDPNDKDSETISVTKDYSDVASKIRTTLIEQKTSIKADNMMIKAIDDIDKNIIKNDIKKPTSEFYKENRGDYQNAGKTISEEYGIPVYTGKTGKLSAETISGDSNLGSLQVPSTKGFGGIELGRYLFAVDEIGETKLGRFDPAKPFMWKNIGPLKSSPYRPANIIALVRIIEAKKPFVPESVDLSYDIKTVVLDKSTLLSENIYNVKDDVIDDLKGIAARKIAKEQAEEFVALLEKEDDWKKAIEKFNKTLENKEVPVGMIRLSPQPERTRTSLFDRKMQELRSAENNSAQARRRKKFDAAARQLQEKLYKLIEANETAVIDKSETEMSPAIIESAPDNVCYVVKDVSKTPVTIEDYEKSRSRIAFQLNMTRSDALALQHFLPENIKKRMGFEWTEKADKPEEEDKEENETDKDGEA